MNYLASLKESFATVLPDVILEETSEDTALMYSTKAPFLDEGNVVYRITTQNIGDSYVRFQVMMFLYNGIDKEKIEAISVLANHINNYLSLGSLSVWKDTASVFYNHGFVIHTSMSFETVQTLLAESITIMETYAFKAGKKMYEFLSDEKGLEEIIGTGL